MLAVYDDIVNLSCFIFLKKVEIFRYCIFLSFREKIWGKKDMATILLRRQKSPYGCLCTSSAILELI